MLSFPANVLLFPIRHHSPACAWHLQQLLYERRPAAVLVEGPSDATSLIDYLVHPQTHAPIAIYTTFVDTRNALESATFERSNPSHFAAYYPLADFSPELVALRVGRKLDADVRFIDLPFPQLVIAEGGSYRAELRSLLDERHLRHGQYIQALCAQTGSRDPDDLWDHLYEHDYRDLPANEFIRRVETYCALSRADYTDDMLAAEGHGAREAAMAAAVRDVASRTDGLVVVVTGGFHTPGLRDLLNCDTKPVSTTAPPGQAQTLLMRYGFAQLDRLNGYASGMPSPAFQQRIWEHLHRSEQQKKRVSETVVEPARQAAAEFIVELGRASRDKRPGLSTADEIAALDQTCRLAAFRGHCEPTREDLLDGIRSACIKGAIDIEGERVLALAYTLLAGDRIGDLCRDVGVAPLVADFRRTAAQLKLDILSHQQRDITLDLYRKIGHRATSRFFYRLTFLNVPFAQLRAGPDFVTGQQVERMHETWRYTWTPSTETVLTERSLYGGTLEEACAARLEAQIDEGLALGLGRRSDLAAGYVIQACRMGLHGFAPRLLTRTAELIAEDSEFRSVVATAEQLLMLFRSREPLEAHSLHGIAPAVEAAYERACYLLPDLAHTSLQDEPPTVDAINALQQVALVLGESERRTQLRRVGLRALVSGQDTVAAIRGAAVGALYADGALSDDELVRVVSGHISLNGPDFLRGLLRTHRACVWQVSQLTVALNRALCDMSQHEFVRLLPDLRLAFSTLTAREADYLARAVTITVGAQQVPSLKLTDASPHDLLLGAMVDQRVREALVRDGLAAFLQQERT